MFKRSHKQPASPYLPEVKTVLLIDVFLSLPVSIRHCCFSLSTKREYEQGKLLTYLFTHYMEQSILRS
jgi:hypothetical protein